MATDLQILREIEKALWITLKPIEPHEILKPENSKVYSLDENEHVTGLNLMLCKVTDISVLKELPNLTEI